MDAGKKETKLTDHISAWATLVASAIALVLGVLNRSDLADNKRDFESQKKLFDEKMTALSSAFEKAHKLEISPRLECEASHEPVEMIEENFAKFTEFRIKNIGRGHAYKTNVDVMVNHSHTEPIPKDYADTQKELPTEKSDSGTCERIVEDRTITTGSAIDHLHITSFGQGLAITGVGGYIRMTFFDGEGNKSVDIQPFAIVIIPRDGKYIGWFELGSTQHEIDWQETSQLLSREISKGRMMTLPAPKPAQ